MISACVERGCAHDALKLHGMMKEDGVEPNEYTYASLLKACGVLQDLQTGKQLHEDARKKGFTSVYFVGNTLVSMYTKCGAISDAVDAFVSLPESGVVAWNAMLSAFIEQGHAHNALKLYRTMRELKVVPNELSLVSALQACGILIEKGEGSAPEFSMLKVDCHRIVQALHSDARKMCFLSNAYVGTTLVCIYGKIGTIEEAENVFVTMPQCNRVSYNAMLLAYIEQGRGEEALQFYQHMQKERIDPDQHTFATVLKACYMVADEEVWYGMDGPHMKHVLEIAKAVYNDAQQTGFALDSYIGTSFLSVCGKCGAISEAEKVFGSFSHRNVVTWTAMLSAYLADGQAKKSLKLYKQMVDDGVNPDQQAFVLAIRACPALPEKNTIMTGDDHWIAVASLEIGKGLHADAQRKGLASDAFVVSSLVNMYGKVGSMLEAECVFCRFFQHSVVAWTAMLSAYVEQCQGIKALQLYSHMQEHGVIPDQKAFLAAAQACGSLIENDIGVVKSSALEITRALHEDVWKNGYASDPFIASSLLVAYGKCGSITEAENVFCGSVIQNIVSWSAMASSFVQQGDGVRALQLYRHMQEKQLTPDPLMVSICIQACRALTQKMLGEGSLMPMEIGRALHADACRQGLTTNIEVNKALMSLYGECGAIEEAENMFLGLPKGDRTFWDAMLSVYVGNGHGEKALLLFRQMQEEGVDPGSVSFVLALQACGILHKNVEVRGWSSKTFLSEMLQALHTDANMKGITSDMLASNTLLHMYGKLGTIVEAEEVFDTLPNCSISSWNAMFSAYVNQGLEVKALELFKKMQFQEVGLDDITVICILQVCSEAGHLALCHELHTAVMAADCDMNLSLTATLIHAYGRCACTVDGQAIFAGLSSPHLASWTACLRGHAGSGHLIESLMLFEELLHVGVKLDANIFTAVLAACSHAGFVVGGTESFMSIKSDHHLSPDVTHYGTMVDLLGRAGNFLWLEDLLSRIPLQIDPSIWSSLLGACRVHGYLELGKQAFYQAVQFHSKEGSAYVIMSNIMADDLEELAPVGNATCEAHP
ncbi:hypothetical protein KP509_18G062200 [Ceratopteris richardii]|nr:hypothetical protein KP509_18G062200 [Ceratopteris richardii]